jgi:hypothetical protein
LQVYVSEAPLLLLKVLPKGGGAMYVDSAARDPESGLGGVASTSSRWAQNRHMLLPCTMQAVELACSGACCATMRGVPASMSEGPG